MQSYSCMAAAGTTGGWTLLIGRVSSVTPPHGDLETQRQVEPRKSRRHDRRWEQEPLRRRGIDGERLIECGRVAGVEQVIHVDADVRAPAAEAQDLGKTHVELIDSLVRIHLSGPQQVDRGRPVGERDPWQTAE